LDESRIGDEGRLVERRDAIAVRRIRIGARGEQRAYRPVVGEVRG
jgi:hypothetical protein